MRVRYKIVGQEPAARCDMEDNLAKRLYKNLFSNGRCEWAELVGEDDGNYMDILESFDHEKLARSIAEIIGKQKGER